MVHARLPPLISMEQPPLDAVPCLRPSLRRHMRRIRTVTRLRQPKCHAELALQPQRYKLALLLFIAKVHEHNDVRKVPDHRVLSLQVVEQTKTFCREMFPYDRHPKVAAASIRTILPTVLLWEGKSVETSFIGEFPRLCKELFPLLARQATIVPVGSRMFAAVVEEAVIVVFVLGAG
jgi:hypothetical protein